jgi:hypothetical protein
MKKIFIFSVIILVCMNSFSQNVAINNNGQQADASAMLDISSTSKGLLIPRMNTSQRTAIVTPARGLMVYDSDIQSFWYWTGLAWKEILFTGAAITPTGIAGGDLYGSFPTPNVGKIQNLDVAFGVPNDKQVMKWDVLNNRWQGMNDSLFLPYNASFGSSAKLFGITNTNNTNGATAVYGKSGAGSGIAPALSIGVWGDNLNGAGVMGTSSNGVGTYGYSVNNHGAYGFTSSSNSAGVYGTRINPGAAVMGDLYSTGNAIYGKSNGTTGKAAWFENVNTANTDTVAKFINNGTGLNSYFDNTNSNSTEGLITGDHFGKGSGVSMRLWNAQNNNPGFYIYQYGNGDGIYSGSNKSKSANFYSNAGNTDTTLYVHHDGTGKGVQVNITNASNNSEAFNVTTAGTGNVAKFLTNNAANNSETINATTTGSNSAAKFVINNATNSSPAVNVNTDGMGKGLQSTISNSSNLAAAVYGSSSGNKGVEGIAQVYGVIGQSTGFTGGIGVFGQSSGNSADGIGVKAISYSTGANSTIGTVTAINNSDGTAIYADATGGGIAVYGQASRINGPSIYAINDASQGQALRGSSTGTDGIGIYTESGNGSSQSMAAYFRNNYFLNNRNVVQVVTNGVGKALSIQNTNASNNNEMLRIQNAGTAEFLLCVDETLNTKASIAKNGNIATDGTITVKANKGIVRNSSATQLRTEIITVNIPAGSLSHYDQFNGAILVTVNFSTAFSSVPAVYIGNLVGGDYQGLTPSIDNVTTTSCRFLLQNFTPYDFTISATSVKIIAIGAE